jgi:tRNA(Ile2) C34 agmatinyltransferase TiaS
MSAAQIICPHCKTSLNLPVELEVKRELKRSGARTISLGGPGSDLPCPKCGRPISVTDIIDGKHDPKPQSTLGCLADLLGFGIVIVIFGVVIAKCSK